MARNLRAVIGTSRWPSAGLHITCVDAYTGERCVVTKAARVRVPRAAAASSAVPGLFPPQPILDRRCMDGGVSGTGIHLDVLAGARRGVVLCLTDGHDVTEGRMTTAPGSIEGDVAALRASGTDLFLRTPEAMEVEKLMDPAAVPEAIEMGARQARADAEELRSFLA
jgi:NTE family protein